MGHVYGYARVSTPEQDPALQVDALIAAGCERVFVDHASGKKTARPEFDLMWSTLLVGDTLVVWRLDRLGRSLSHLVEMFTELGEREVAFRSLSEAIDTSTAAGRLMFHVMGALAEFEHQLILERTRAGIESARARGRMGGRPPVLTPTQLSGVRSMYMAGKHTRREIADAFGVSLSTVTRAVRPPALPSSA